MASYRRWQYPTVWPQWLWYRDRSSHFLITCFCSGPGWFESHFVRNSKARFSHVMAHMYMCVWCRCSLLLIYVFSLCLRAPWKIDSSIGLPSLNKVLTYLLTYLLIYCVYYCRTGVWLHIEGDSTPQFDYNGYVIGTETVSLWSLICCVLYCRTVVWLHIEGDSTPQFDHNGYVIGSETATLWSLICCVLYCRTVVWLHIEGDSTPKFDHNGYVIGTETVTLWSLICCVLYCRNGVWLHIEDDSTPKFDHNGYVTGREAATRWSLICCVLYCRSLASYRRRQYTTVWPQWLCYRDRQQSLVDQWHEELVTYR